MIPWILGPESLAELNEAVVVAGAGFSCFFAVLILLLWVPSYKEMPETAKSYIVGAYILFAIAGLFLVFGIYFMALCTLLLLGLIIYILWKSILIMRGKI